MTAMAGLVALALTFGWWPRQPTYQGKSVDGWLKEVFNFQAPGGGNRQAQALQALRAMGPKAVPFQIEVLARTDSRCRQIYRKLFRKLSPKVQQYLPPPRDHRAMRFAASLALQNNGQTRSFLSELVPLLKHQDPEVRVQVSVLIGQYILPENKDLLPLLTPALRDSDARVRKHMVYALAAMGPGAEAALPELTKALEDSDLEVREGARKVLPRIHPETGSAR